MSQNILDESTKHIQCFLLKKQKYTLNLQLFPGGGGLHLSRTSPFIKGAWGRRPQENFLDKTVNLGEICSQRGRVNMSFF